MAMSREGSQMQQKRLYQLSMLQLLVGMAVVAGLFWLNQPGPAAISVFGIPANYDWITQEVGAFRSVSGLSFPFRYSGYDTTFGDLTVSFEPTGKSLTIAPALIANVLTGIGIAAFVVLTVGLITKKRTCPSPSS